MKITPLDIRRKEFKRSVRGYSDEEVDIFLDEVADEFERLFQENMELHDRMSRMDEQIAGHAQLKDALEKTLISAQLQAEELRANAHKESELILRDAEMKARGIVSDSYGETQKTQQTLVQLKLLEEDFRFKFRSLLEGYLRLLSQAPLASVGSEAPVVPQTPSPKSEATPPPAPSGTPAPDVARVSTPVPSPTVPTGAAEPAQWSAAPSARPVALDHEQVPLQSTPGVPRVPTPPVQSPPAAPVAPPTAMAPATPVNPVVPSTTATPPAPPVLPRVEPMPPASAPEPPAVPQVVRPAAPPVEQAPPQPLAARPAETPRPVGPRFDDDAPTQEADTAETSLIDETASPDRAPGQEPLRRFFFGRQMNDVDDTFQSDEGNTRDRNRDFEW